MSDKQSIRVPLYFAEFFGRKLTFERRRSKEKMMLSRRVNLLINHALEDLPCADWYIFGTKYRGSSAYKTYGIEFDGTMTYVFIDRQDARLPVAIFKNSHLAADYFVYLVSAGQREINWELYLEANHGSLLMNRLNKYLSVFLKI